MARTKRAGRIKTALKKKQQQQQQLAAVCCTFLDQPFQQEREQPQPVPEREQPAVNELQCNLY